MLNLYLYRCVNSHYFCVCNVYMHIRMAQLSLGCIDTSVVLVGQA